MFRRNYSDPQKVVTNRKQWFWNAEKNFGSQENDYETQSVSDSQNVLLIRKKLSANLFWSTQSDSDPQKVILIHRKWSANIFWSAKRWFWYAKSDPQISKVIRKSQMWFADLKNDPQISESDPRLFCNWEMTVKCTKVCRKWPWIDSGLILDWSWFDPQKVILNLVWFWFDPQKVILIRKKW